MFAGKNRAYRLVEFIKIVTGWRRSSFSSKQHPLPQEKEALMNNGPLSEDHSDNMDETFFVIETDQAEVLVADSIRIVFLSSHVILWRLQNWLMVAY